MSEKNLHDLMASVTEIAADALIESGLFDRVTSTIGSALAVLPEIVDLWLGPQARTPANSAPPRFVPPEPGEWSGLVVVEANEARSWLLIRTDVRHRQLNQGPVNPASGDWLLPQSDTAAHEQRFQNAGSAKIGPTSEFPEQGDCDRRPL